MKVEGVLFDYGLVLSGPPDPAAWATMRNVTGLSEDAFSAAYWRRRLDYDRGTINGREYWHEIAQSAGLKPEQSELEQLIAADNTLWTQINQPMVDWALRLQTAGTPTGILSNLGDEMMHGVLAALPWVAKFNHHTWSHKLLMAKPEAGIYLHAAQGMGLQADRILFVDDRAENVAGAIAAGMQAIRYEDHAVFEQELAARGGAELWKSGRTTGM